MTECLHPHVTWADDNASATCDDCGLTATREEMEEAVHGVIW